MHGSARLGRLWMGPEPKYPALSVQVCPLGVIFAHFRQFSLREPLGAPKAGLDRPSGDKENGRAPRTAAYRPPKALIARRLSRRPLPRTRRVTP